MNFGSILPFGLQNLLRKRLLLIGLNFISKHRALNIMQVDHKIVVHNLLVSSFEWCCVADIILTGKETHDEDDENTFHENTGNHFC